MKYTTKVVDTSSKYRKNQIQMILRRRNCQENTKPSPIKGSNNNTYNKIDSPLYSQLIEDHKIENSKPISESGNVKSVIVGYNGISKNIWHISIQINSR